MFRVAIQLVNLEFRQIHQKALPCLKKQFYSRVRPIRSSGFKTQKIPKQDIVEKSDVFGKMCIAGASAAGLGALCFYGARQSRGDSIIEQSAFAWSETTIERIQSTYGFFVGGVGLTALTATSAFKNGTVQRLMSRGSPWMMVGCMLVSMASGMITMSLPYPEHGFGMKHIAFAGHSSLMGLMLAPICIIGGPLLTRAALYTGGVIGGLSAIAISAPSEKFLNWGGPLGIGLGVVVVSSLGSAFMSPTSALGGGLYAISMYGGLLLFSGFLLYDTQKIIKRATEYPNDTIAKLSGYPPFDPVNACMGIYMDTLNIFIRIASILASNNRKK